MHIKIQKMFRFFNAEAELKNGVNFVTGPNSAGKSSFATILAALVSHNSNPLSLSTAHQKRYVRDGDEDGIAVLRDGEYEVRWQPPNKMAHTQDSMPISNGHAAGMIDFIKPVQAKARSEMWEMMFVPANPKTVLGEEWPKELGDQMKWVVDAIEKDGWDGALKMYTDQRRSMKAQWEEVTGKRYGSSIAREWMPKGFTTDLENTSEEKLQEDLQTARDLARGLESRQIMTEGREAESERLAAELAEYSKEMTEYDKKKNECQKKMNAIYGDEEYIKYEDDLAVKMVAIKDLENAVGDQSRHYNKTTCPCCDKEIYIGIIDDHYMQIKTAEDIQKEHDEEEANRAKLNAAIGEYEQITSAHHEKFLRKLEELDIEYKQYDASIMDLQCLAKEKRTILDNHLAMQGQGGVTEEEVDQARQKVADCETALQAFKAYRDAKVCHEWVNRYDRICDLLGPTGVRANLMKKRMDQVRKSLASVTKVTGWLPIEMMEDYSLTSGGRPVQLCAANEKLKAQWALQVAIALVTKAKVVILDNADTLRGEHWTGLLDMANKLVEKFTDVTLVICATENHDGVPDGWNVINVDQV